MQRSGQREGEGAAVGGKSGKPTTAIRQWGAAEQWVQGGREEASPHQAKTAGRSLRRWEAGGCYGSGGEGKLINELNIFLVLPVPVDAHK